MVHNITNYVTANDVANIILACGANPVMADEPAEVEEITALCGALNINLGTLNMRRAESMFRAGRAARRLGHPIVLDPVGAGSSRLRTDTALRIIRELEPDVVRGNISEIRSLICGSGSTKGVDANGADAVTEDKLGRAVSFVKNAALQIGGVVVVSGAIDLASDGSRCYVVRNGRPEMSRVTGTGCQLSGMVASFLAAVHGPGERLEAVAAAVCGMGLAGEVAWEHMEPYEGNSAYRGRIIDAVSLMDGAVLDRGANYEVW